MMRSVDSITEEETLANAEWMRTNLLALGWDTVVVDFFAGTTRCQRAMTGC